VFRVADIQRRGLVSFEDFVVFETREWNMLGDSAGFKRDCQLIRSIETSEFNG